MMCKDDNTISICVKCNKEREGALMRPGRKYCRICDSYSKHRSNALELKPFDDYEYQFLENRRMEKESTKQCAVCNTEFSKTDLNKRNQCKSCRKFERRKYRANKAIREGREPDRRHLHDGHVRTFSKFNNDPARFMLSFVMRGAAFNLWTHQSWRETAHQEYVELYLSNFKRSGMTAAEQYRDRYNNDIEFQIKERVRRQQNKALKHDGVGELIRGAIRRDGKSNRVQQLLGYTIAELKQHLENQFTDGMTWDAFRDGDIHIDHIIPQAAFDLSDDEQWRKCWSLDNLQPLWSHDNLAKSDRLPCGRYGREVCYNDILDTVN